MSNVLGSRRAALLVMLLFLALAAGLLASRGLLITQKFHDLYYVYDGSLRARLGQTPHLDFHSPIGQAFYWPYALLAPFGRFTPLTVLHANLLVAAALLPAMLFTLGTRLRPGLYLLAAASVLTMTLATRDLDHGITDYSHLAPYNRWGTSLMMLAAFVALIKRPSTRQSYGAVVDGVVLGSVLWLLFYLKINFFAGGFGVVVAGLVLRQLDFATVGWTLATFALGMAGVEIAFGNNAAYLADILLSLRAHASAEAFVDQGFRLSQFVLSGFVGLISGILITASLWLRDPGRELNAWLLRHWKPLLIAAGLIATGAVVGFQNHAEVEFGMYTAAAIVAAQLAWPTSNAVSPAAAMPGQAFRTALAGLLLIVPAAFLPLLDAASVFAHAAESRTGGVCALPGSWGPGVDDLLFPAMTLAGDPRLEQRDRSALRLLKPRPGAFDGDGGTSCPRDLPTRFPPSQSASEADELLRLAQGVQLVRRHVGPGDTVLALDFANPYPFISGTPPPKHTLIWWDYLRNFSLDHHPTAGPLLGAATVVLQPTDIGEPTVDALWRLYGADVARRFTPVAQSDRWRVWRKSPPASATRSQAGVRLAP